MKNNRLQIVFPLVCWIFCSCNPKITNNVPYPDVEGEGHVHEDLSSEDHVADSIPEVNSIILSTSLYGLELVEERWDQTMLYNDTTVEFLLVRPTSMNTVVAIAVTPIDSENNGSDFFFYELDLTGAVLSKTQLYNSDYSCYLNQNLQEFQNTIHYFRKKNPQEEWVYDLATKTHKRTENKLLDWVKINDWKKQNDYPSPDSSKVMHLEATNLSLIKEGALVKLISQPYSGDWSFGFGCWNSNGSTFFFDNSGAVACIWKIDLTAKTLAKIVPEHAAKCPNVVVENGKSKLLYCEGSSIKIASE